MERAREELGTVSQRAGDLARTGLASLLRGGTSVLDGLAREAGARRSAGAPRDDDHAEVDLGDDAEASDLEKRFAELERRMATEGEMEGGRRDP